MSTSQALGVVGYAVGFWIGGPAGGQIGYAIGAAVGGYIDPTVIKGPRLTDAMQQTVSDGVPIPWGFGTYPTAGNIIWRGELIERKHEDDGKGSGQVQVTYTYHRSYAIGICQGVRQPDGTCLPIAGILQAKRNGKVVYDLTPGVSTEMQAQNAKFLRNGRFFLGSEDQLPSSVIEAEEGVGDAPAYPGLVYVVMEDDDLTDFQGAIPQWEFVVSVCGDVTNTGGSGSPGALLVTGQPSGLNDYVFASAVPTSSPAFVGIDTASGADILLGIGNAFDGVAVVIGESEFRWASDVSGPWVGGSIDLGGSIPNAIIGGDNGWLAKAYFPFGSVPIGPNPPNEFTNASPSAGTFTDGSPTTIGPAEGRRAFRAGDYYYTTSNNLLLRALDPNGPWQMVWDEPATIAAGWDPNGPSIIYFFDGAEYEGRLYCAVRWQFNEAFAQYQIRWSPDWGQSWPDEGIVYSSAIGASGSGQPLQLCVAGGALIAYCYGDIAGLRTSSDGFVTLHDLAVAGESTPPSLDQAKHGRRIATFGGRVYVIGANVDGDKCVTFDVSTQSVISTVTMPIENALSIVTAPSQAVPIPDAPSWYIDPNGEVSGPGGEQLERCKPTIGEIVAEACLRSGLTTDDFDVSELTDEIDGYKVAIETSGEAIIGPLMQGWFFDAAEFDDKIRFPKRGGDVVAELTADDLCESDGDVIEETELQEAELLQKVHVKTIDPAAGYTVTTQTAERRTSTVLAKGEQSVELAVVTDKDTQARIADKKLKVGWAETRRFKTCVPYTRPDLTVTDVVGLTDRKGKRSRARFMEMSEDSGRIEVSEAMLDRQSSYTSNVEGVTTLPPTDTSPGLIGPTFGVAMNLPSLRTQDNVPGAYIAACGYLSGWTGCTVLLSSDGGISYQQVSTFMQPSSMGVLRDSATASSEPLEVFMRSGTLSSITDVQLAARQNAFAITTGGVSEIGQFKTATQDSSGVYDLTETLRGQLGTAAASHSENSPFVMVASAQFLPLDLGLSGKTLYFKFVSFGTSPDDAEAIPFVFNPLFTSVTVSNLTEGGENITVNGQPIYVVTANA